MAKMRYELKGINPYTKRKKSYGMSDSFTSILGLGKMISHAHVGGLKLSVYDGDVLVGWVFCEEFEMRIAVELNGKSFRI